MSSSTSLINNGCVDKLLIHMNEQITQTLSTQYWRYRKENGHCIV